MTGQNTVFKTCLQSGPAVLSTVFLQNRVPELKRSLMAALADQTPFSLYAAPDHKGVRAFTIIRVCVTTFLDTSKFLIADNRVRFVGWILPHKNELPKTLVVITFPEQGNEFEFKVISDPEKVNTILELFSLTGFVPADEGPDVAAEQHVLELAPIGPGDPPNDPPPGE